MKYQLARLGGVFSALALAIVLTGWTNFTLPAPTHLSIIPVKDSIAVRALTRMQKAIMAAQSIAVVAERTEYNKSGVRNFESISTIKILRPDRYLIRYWSRDYDEKEAKWGEPATRIYSGTAGSRYAYTPGDTVYTKTTSIPSFRSIWYAEIYGGFFLGKDWDPVAAGYWSMNRLDDPKLIAIRDRGTKVYRAETCRVVEWQYKNAYETTGNDHTYSTEIYIGPDDLPRRMVTTDNGVLYSDISYQNTERNTVTVSDVSYSIPTGVVMKEESDNSYLAIGSKAPLFNLPASADKNVSLSEAIGKGKVVIVKGFSLTCNTCRAEMAQIEQIYKEYRTRGVEFYAVFSNDTSAKYSSFIVNNSIGVPILLANFDDTSDPINKYESLYNAAYIIDQNGNIAYAAEPARPAMRRTLDWLLAKPGVK